VAPTMSKTITRLRTAIDTLTRRALAPQAA
jgi:hypothetical protein